MKIVNLKAVLGMALVGLALVATQAASAEPLAVDPRPMDDAAATPRFASLDHAVEAGVLDVRVLNELRRQGAADAIVSVSESIPTSSLPSSIPSRIDVLRRLFAARKSVVLAHGARDMDILRRYENLPATLVRFESADTLLDVVNSELTARVLANVAVPVATSQSLTLIGQPQAAAAGRIGSGTYVAVIDTGLDYKRSPFGCTAPGVPAGCKVVDAEEMDGDTETALDEGGFHGTNVAGIVSSVAPGAKILAYDVFDWKWIPATATVAAHWDLRADPADQLDAIEDILDRKRAGVNVVAFNMSLGGGHYTSACNAGLSFATARSLGIIPVVSAGNGRYVEGVAKLGISAPACDPNALSVGAVHDSAHPMVSGACEAGAAADRLTSFTQTASILDMLAPGSCITAAGITMQGTSMAAPHVAGAVAVLSSAKYGSALLSRAGADLIKSTLESSGPSIYDSLSGVSRKRLDLPAALQALLGTAGGTDTTAPAMGSVVENLDGPVSSSGAIVKISWSATDASGIAEYALYSRVNGGQWTRQTTAATATSARFTLAFGTKYEFAVQAKDGAGNWSVHAYSPALTPGYSDDSSWSLPGWTRYSWASAFGGTYVTSSQANASITHTFTGRDVGLVASRFSTAGRVHVYCDGAFKATVDLYSATLQARELAYWCRFAQSGTHTMKVVVEGTTGRPRVDVDAFVRLS